MERVDKVIDFFLSKESMSPKKLQKMLYYAYAWTLALLNEDEDHLENKLFDGKFGYMVRFFQAFMLGTKHTDGMIFLKRRMLRLLIFHLK